MCLRTLERYLRFHKSKYGQQKLSQQSAKQFILYRKKSGRYWPTINCDYSALRKYFREVIQAEWTLKKMPRPRKENTLPRIISYFSFLSADIAVPRAVFINTHLSSTFLYAGIGLVYIFTSGSGYGDPLIFGSIDMMTISPL